MFRSVAVFAAFLLISLTPGALSAQKMPWQSDSPAGGHSDASPQSVEYLFPEQISVPACKDTVVELHFRVKQGMHVNSHQPREKSLIPTQFIAAEDGNVDISAVDFPEGSDYVLPSMPNDKLSVYTGEFVLKAHIRARAGDHMLEGALRYQACDDHSCYPPRKAPVAVDVIAR
ncbi:protein-disulfide reductase DsbD domain-containing protein [Silvibacterium sp.]|uniref:protein-disulfide reductase DsbD domain-containing protein n=1 Tax=Silvibacterium sp. TaxID=1964179 RepID=UPI0039E311FF